MLLESWHRLPLQDLRVILESKSKNEKFLSEFLCWRELSYYFCFYNPKYLVLKAVLQHGHNTLISILLTSDLTVFVGAIESILTVDVLWNLCLDPGETGNCITI